MNRLLVVEDDEQVRTTIKRVLRSTPIEICFAENGLEALRLLETSAFDFIISDVDMPKMNGIQFFNRVACDYPSLVSKFVFFTSRNPDDVNSQLDVVGVVVYDKMEFLKLRTFVTDLMV